jgi:hypothetical protein
MIWEARSGLAGVTVVVGLAALTGCGVVGGTEAEPEPEPGTAELRSAAAEVREASTLRTSFTISQSGGTIDGGTLTGEAEVVAAADMAVTYTYGAEGVGDEVEIDGELLAVDDQAFVRSSGWQPPPGREWFSVDPDTPARLDEPIVAEWFTLVMSRLCDPLFLLDQGLPEVPDLTTTPTTVDGVAATEYSVEWNLELDGAGPELAAWADQIGDAAVLSVSLWVDADGRPVKLEVGSSTAVMLFEATITFDDYGAAVTVAAPAPGEVAEV